MKRSYLEHIKIVSFGAFSNKAVGPFAPHLNVVYGPNEAGKTTVASFVGGVLFGWEEARAAATPTSLRMRSDPDRCSSPSATRPPAFRPRRRMRPPSPPRTGAAPPSKPTVPSRRQLRCFPRLNPPARPELELSRVRNSDGLQGDASLVSDLDKETFQTMFSLTSDELRTLRNTTDVTAKLLTAGSGTGASPAHALATVQEKLAEYTSRAPASSTPSPTSRRRRTSCAPR